MTGALEDHVGALRDRGFTVVEGVLRADEIEAARAALDRIFRREAGVGARRGWHTDAFKVAYMLPAKDPLFLSFGQHETLALVRAVLGPRCVLSALNGLSTVPGGRAQALHIDQRETVPGALLTVNALHTLDDFTRENGCTRLVPASQDRIWTGRSDEIEAAEAEAIHVEAPAGSLIAFNGALWHAAGRNATAGERRAVHAFFARDWVCPQWDFPRSLSRRTSASLTSEQRRIFGFDTGPSRFDARGQREVGPGWPRRWRPGLGWWRQSTRGRGPR